MLPYVLYCICAPALPTRCRFVVGAEEAALLTEPRRLFLCVYALFAPPCALRLCAPHSISRPVVAAENGHLFVSAWKGEEEEEEREEETGGNLFLAAGFLEKHAAAAQRGGGGGNVEKRGITLQPTDTGRAIEVNGCFFELELASALAVGARKWLLFYQSG